MRRWLREQTSNQAKFYRNYNSASVKPSEICWSNQNVTVIPRAAASVSACVGLRVGRLYLQACCWSSSSAICLTSQHSHSPTQIRPASAGAARGRPSLFHLSSLKKTKHQTHKHLLVLELLPVFSRPTACSGMLHKNYGRVWKVQIRDTTVFVVFPLSHKH